MAITSPVRLLSAIALLSALMPASPALCAGISDLAAFPNPFSPNGDGIYDTVEVSYSLSDSAWVEVDVLDSLGSVVRNLNAGDWDQGPGPHRYTWRGLDDASQEQPDGRYTLVVGADGGEHRELVIVLDTQPPLVGDLLVQPSRFSPDGDGVADSALVSFTLTAVGPADRFWVDVVDPSGESSLELLTGVGSDTVSVYWDGSNPEGGAAPDTVYTLSVRAVDAAGNTDDQETLIDLDIDAPSLFVDYAPDPLTSEIRVAVSADTTIAGVAYDRSGVDHVEVSVDGGATWSFVQSRRDPLVDSNVSWSHSLQCEECSPGTRDDTTSVLVRAHDATLTSDGLGHFNTGTTSHPRLSFDVVFDVAAPIHEESSTDDSDATFETGQKIEISTYWDAQGYAIEADFSLVDSSVDSMFDMSEVEWHDLHTGMYTIEFTTSSGNSLVPVYDAPVRIRATDDFGRAVTDTTLTVTILASSSSVPGLSVNRNSFDPNASESVRITLGDSGDGATVDIYNMAGVLVRTLYAGGAGEVTWHGRNDEGEVVASGVYFLHIKTAAGDATRTVAVIK